MRKGFQKGVSGNPAGKKPGTTNEFTRTIRQFFIDRDFNPLLKMVELAHLTEDETIKFGCYKELAQYYAPKLRSMEVTGEVQNPLNFVINIKKGHKDESI